MKTFIVESSERTLYYTHVPANSIEEAKLKILTGECDPNCVGEIDHQIDRVSEEGNPTNCHPETAVACPLLTETQRELGLMNANRILRGSYGSFMAHLAEAFVRADMAHSKRLFDAFPEVFQVAGDTPSK